MTEENQVAPWDDIYRGDAEVFSGPVPWNIGEPQPEIAGLIAEGRFRSDVLDAGCGHAETSLHLAAQGVHGGGPGPVADGHRSGAGGRRRSWTDDGHVSGGGHQFVHRFRRPVLHDRRQHLFHSLPVDRRRDYLRAVARAAAPGASYYILVFAKAPSPRAKDRTR